MGSLRWASPCVDRGKRVFFGMYSEATVVTDIVGIFSSAAHRYLGSPRHGVLRTLFFEGHWEAHFAYLAKMGPFCRPIGCRGAILSRD